jgi:hypothetical protein
MMLRILWPLRARQQKADSPQQVVEIQKRKKKLAEVTFGSEQMSEEGIGLGTLLASHVSCNPETKLIVIQYLKSVLE